MRTKQSAVRLSEPLRERLEALIPALSIPGHEATQSDVLREVIIAGLPVVEKAYGTKPPANMSDPMRTAQNVETTGRRGGNGKSGGGE